MRISKARLFLSVVVFFLIVFVLTMISGLSVLALKDGRYHNYSQNSIYFYDPDCSPSYSGGGGNNNKLVGNSRAERIWNYIVDLNRSGLSDKPEVIAGILGNMSVETGGTFNPFIQNGSGCTGLIQWCKGSWNDGFFSYMANKNLDKYYYHGAEPAIDESIIDKGINAELDFLFKNGSHGVTADKYLANLSVPNSKTGVNGARAYADLFLVVVENAYGGSDTIEDSGVRAIAPYTKYQAANGRRNEAESFYNKFKNSVGDEDSPEGGDEDDEGDDIDYCNDYGNDDDNGGDGGESGNCEEEGTCDDYVFPLKGATKANYMHGSALSPLPCTRLYQGGCHHDYYAMDLGLTTGTKSESNFPDLVGVFNASYWKSVGVKVVAMSSGKITSYKTYSRATMGYTKKCASVTYETNDGRKFWLGHMTYNHSRKAGDTFGTGDVIGEVGPPTCAISTTAHLHVDETPKYGSNGSVETVKLINTLYERLP